MRLIHITAHSKQINSYVVTPHMDNTFRQTSGLDIASQDICVAECIFENGQTVISVAVYISPNQKFFCLVHSVVSYRVLKREVNKEKIRYVLQFFRDKDENASQVAEIVNGNVCGADTVTPNYVQFWFSPIPLKHL
ncbi:hypothetical protein TNCV_374251 [Trichonephila clavipes]|nr:hypothetical protein TNCV_374251 [Trichonephila clavipes]